jgi:hypothetical protein
MGEAASHGSSPILLLLTKVPKRALGLDQAATPKPECARLAVNDMGETKATLMVRAAAGRSF